MFVLTVTMPRRCRRVVCHSAAQAAGVIRSTAALWGVSPLALDWSAKRGA